MDTSHVVNVEAWEGSGGGGEDGGEGGEGHLTPAEHLVLENIMMTTTLGSVDILTCGVDVKQSPRVHTWSYSGITPLIDAVTAPIDSSPTVEIQLSRVTQHVVATLPSNVVYTPIESEHGTCKEACGSVGGRCWIISRTISRIAHTSTDRSLVSSCDGGTLNRAWYRFYERLSRVILVDSNAAIAKPNRCPMPEEGQWMNRTFRGLVLRWWNSHVNLRLLHPISWIYCCGHNSIFSDGQISA